MKLLQNCRLAIDGVKGAVFVANFKGGNLCKYVTDYKLSFLQFLTELPF